MLDDNVIVSVAYKQVVKVIWHKAASPPHTDSIRQCAPHAFSTPRTGAAPAESLWVHLSLNMTGHVLKRQLFAIKITLSPFTCDDLDLLLLHGSFGPPESISQMPYRSVQLVLQGWRLTVVTNRPRYSVCNN